MAAPTNAVQTFAQIGIREELSDVILNLSPTETPFMTMAKKGTTKSRTPEWMKDRLRAPNPANAVIEGNDSTGTSLAQPTRLKNIVQLFEEVVIVSDTARSVDTAGRNDELKYQIAKSGKALKTDMEMRFLGNYASVVGNSTTAGQSAGAEAWLTTNVDRGATGANGGFSAGIVSAATDGTTRVYSEALLKAVIKKVWDYGGDPSIIMMTGSKKQTASTFAGIAAPVTQIEDNQKSIQIYGATDFYKSDFGHHKFVANRFVGAATSRTATNGLYPGNSVLVLSPDTWQTKFLQPFRVVELARTGHAEKRLLRAEATLACMDEGGNGVIADLT